MRIKQIADLFKKNANWRTLLLTVFGIVYLILGALVFKSVENENEDVMKKQLFAQESAIK